MSICEDFWWCLRDHSSEIDGHLVKNITWLYYQENSESGLDLISQTALVTYPKSLNEKKLCPFEEESYKFLGYSLWIVIFQWSKSCQNISLKEREKLIHLLLQCIPHTHRLTHATLGTIFFLFCLGGSVYPFEYYAPSYLLQCQFKWGSKQTNVLQQIQATYKLFCSLGLEIQ